MNRRKLTAPEALAEMQRGRYLLRQNKRDGIGNHKTILRPVKPGTIEELLKKELIREDINGGRYLLTDAGRHFNKVSK